MKNGQQIKNRQQITEVNVKVFDRGAKNHFRRNDMSFTDLVKEFLDNSVQQMMEDPSSENVDAKIKISGYDENGRLDLQNSSITVSDNGKGIERSELEAALGIWGTQERNELCEDSLNEHGVGMKVAAWSLGDKTTIITKTKTSECATFIPHLDPEGTVPLSDDNTSFGKEDSGTIIKISGLRREGLMDSRGECNAIETMEKAEENMSQLGCTYADHLFRCNTNSPKRMSITAELADKDGEILRSFKVKPQFRHYQGLTTPSEKILKISDDCEASVVFGMAATPEELEAKNINPYGKNHPFERWNKSISIVHKGRVLVIEDLSTFGIPKNQFQQYPIQGELRIIKGFPTKCMKDGLAYSKEWIDLKNAVGKEIKKWISVVQKHSDPMTCNSEREVNEYLARRWRNEGFEVMQEVSVELSGGYIDLMRRLAGSDGEFSGYELKIQQAVFGDLYQPLQYLDFGPACLSRKSPFYIVAPSFSANFMNALPEFNRIHGTNIVPKTFEELGIPFNENNIIKRRSPKSSVQNSITEDLQSKGKIAAKKTKKSIDPTKNQ